MSTQINNSSNSISNLIEKHTAKAAAEKAETERFMLVLSIETRELLRDTCEKIGAKQISFASDLFTAALKDAVKEINKTKEPVK